MTLLLILIGVFVIKFGKEIFGWVIIVISLLARHKQIIEFFNETPKILEGIFGGSKEGQNIKNSNNVFQAKNIKGNVNLFQNTNHTNKKRKRNEEI